MDSWDNLFSSGIYTHTVLFKLKQGLIHLMHKSAICVPYINTLSFTFFICILSREQRVLERVSIQLVRNLIYFIEAIQLVCYVHVRMASRFSLKNERTAFFSMLHALCAGGHFLHNFGSAESTVRRVHRNRTVLMDKRVF